ncbi:hypothetical protein EDB19DRAFT_1641406 [Suillus lakei]|nr:hypothetical protein EDB19DRAFT_1641406 [Suillus lakei]
MPSRRTSRLAWSDTALHRQGMVQNWKKFSCTMFRWYRNAHVFIVYLHQSLTPSDFNVDE